MDDRSVLNTSQPSATFAATYEALAGRGLRFAYGMLGNVSDAEDVVQDAFCRLWPRRKTIEDDDEFSRLFFATVRNRAIDRIRRRRREPSMTQVSNLMAADLSRSDPQQVERLRAAVAKYMLELPANWADALRLRIDAELSYDEIAKTLQCTRDQVRTWIYRARRQLAEELQANGYLAGENFS